MGERRLAEAQQGRRCIEIIIEGTKEGKRAGRCAAGSAFGTDGTGPSVVLRLPGPENTA